jgi:hypothetical protein
VHDLLVRCLYLASEWRASTPANFDFQWAVSGCMHSQWWYTVMCLMICLRISSHVHDVSCILVICLDRIKDLLFCPMRSPTFELTCTSISCELCCVSKRCDVK